MGDFGKTLARAEDRQPPVSPRRSAGLPLALRNNPIPRSIQVPGLALWREHAPGTDPESDRVLVPWNRPQQNTDSVASLLPSCSVQAGCVSLQREDLYKASMDRATWQALGSSSAADYLSGYYPDVNVRGTRLDSVSKEVEPSRLNPLLKGFAPPQPKRQEETGQAAADAIEPSSGLNDGFYANAFYTIGVRAHQAGDTDRAEKQFQQALHSNPSLALRYKVHTELVSILAQKSTKALLEGDKSGALEPFNEALKKDPEQNFRARLLAGRSRVYGDLLRYPEALADAHKCISLEPNLACGYSAKGAALLGMGSRKAEALEYNAQALEALEKAVLLDPTDEEARANLQSQGIEPADVKKEDSFYKRGEIAMEKGHHAQALQIINEGLGNSAAPQDRIELLAKRSSIYSHLLQFREALSDAEECIQCDPRSPRGYSAKGAALIAMGFRKNEALEALTKAVELDPADEEAKMNLIWEKANVPHNVRHLMEKFSKERNRDDTHLHCTTKSTTTASDDFYAKSFYRLGTRAHQARDTDLAAKLFQQALLSDPSPALRSKLLEEITTTAGSKSDIPHRASVKRVSLLSASKYTGQGPRTLIIEKIIVENIPGNLLGRCKPYLIVNVGDNERQTKLLATLGGEDPVGKNMKLIGFEESLPCDKPAVWNQHMEFEFVKGGKDIIMTVRVMEESSNVYKKNVAVGVFPSIRDEGTGVATFMLRDFSHGLKERKAVLVKDAIPVKGPDGFTPQVRVMARVPAVPEDGPFGIGINFVKRDGDLVVDTLAPNYIHLDGIEPKQGDKVISIDRTSVEGLTFAKIISLTTGELGSPVELEFERITGGAFTAPPVSQYLRGRSSSEVARTLYPTISVATKAAATKAPPEQDLEKLKSDIAELKKEAQKAHLAGDTYPISLEHIELLETQLAEEIKRKVELAEANSKIAQLKKSALNTSGPISLEHIEHAEDKLAEQIKRQAKLVEEIQRQAEDEAAAPFLAQSKLSLRESRAARIRAEEKEQEAARTSAEEEAEKLTVHRLMRSVSPGTKQGENLYFLDSDGSSDDFYANAYYKLGAKAYEDGDTVRAQKLFEDALRSNPRVLVLPEQDLEKLKSDIAELKKEARKAHLAGETDPISLEHIELLETQLAEEMKMQVELAEAKSKIAQLKKAALLNTGGPISLEHIEHAEDKLAERTKKQAKMVEEIQRQAEEEAAALPLSSPLAQNKLWLRESRAARIRVEEEEQEAAKIRAEEEAKTLSVRRLMRSVSPGKKGGGKLYFLDSDGKSDDFYANAYYKLGAKAHQDGDTVRAAKLFEEALRSNPSYKELLKVRVERAALDVVEPDFLTDGALTDQELLEMAGVLEPPEFGWKAAEDFVSVNVPRRHPPIQNGEEDALRKWDGGPSLEGTMEVPIPFQIMTSSLLSAAMHRGRIRHLREVYSSRIPNAKLPEPELNYLAASNIAYL